jgi:hypothetical protein
VTEELVPTTCRPANRNGLPGSRALTVLVIIPDIVAAVTGIFNLIMLEADDVGTEIVVGGTVGAAARGLESKVEFVAFDVGDRITCANKYFRLYAFKKNLLFRYLFDS